MSLAAVERPEAELSEQPVFYVATPILREKTLYKAVKRVFDIVLSFLSLILLLIPMLIIAIIIAIDSPGAPIFKQERLGLNGKPFTIYKFRSMYTDAERDGPRWADLEDKRCTCFGAFLRKTRLDELPQLWNILKGDMSFVGPRPERACFYDEFEKYIVGFSNRLAVIPGLTGHAQVNGGYELKPEEKIIYDMPNLTLICDYQKRGGHEHDDYNQRPRCGTQAAGTDHIRLARCSRKILRSAHIQL